MTLLDVPCDNIASREIPVLENRSEDPLRQEMLNEHLLYGGNGEVRINRSSALLMKIGKCLLKVWIILTFCFDECRQLLTEFPAPSLGIQRTAACHAEMFAS